MIHSFKVENFNSINEKQELDFTSLKIYSNSFSSYEKKYYISNVNCFIGANASGKTNILKAMSFVLWFAENSFYDLDDSNKELFESHKLNKNKPTKFEIIFDSNDKLYKFSVEFLNGKLKKETLEIKSLKGFSFIYKLQKNENELKIKYNRNGILKRINQKEEIRFKLKENVSFFSFLLGTGYLEIFNLKFISKNIYSNVTILGRKYFDNITESIFLSKILEKSDSKKNLLPYLKNFDFGIEDFAENEKFKIKFQNGSEEKLIGFKHSNNKNQIILSVLEESAGTVKASFLAIQLLEILDNGGIVIIDEFDDRLHYEIARKLISLFSNKETNKHNAQLFFSTHQPLFLNDRDKKQIFLCYKEDLLNTEIYRLDEIEGVRNTENFFEKYLSNEYGAMPRIGQI